MIEKFYIVSLHQEFEKQKETDPMLTLRKFSGFLGINSGVVSALLRGRRSMSVSDAVKVLRKLELNALDEASFIKSLGYKPDKLRKLLKKKRKLFAS